MIRIRIVYWGYVYMYMTIIHQDLWSGKLVPSPYKRGKPSNRVFCTVSCRIERICKRIPISNSLGEETALVNVSICKRGLKCQRVMLTDMPNWENKVMLTWYLVLCRERDFALFHNFKLYIAPMHGHTTTWYKFRQHFKAFIISIILYQFRKDPFCLIILCYTLFYFIHVHIAQGRGETTCWDNFFDGSRKVLSLDHWLHFSRKYLCPLIVWYAHFFSWFLYICIAPTGADNPFGSKFWCQQKGLKFKKKISSTSDFIHIISWFNKCILPWIRGRQPPGDKTTPRGQNFDVNRNLLSLQSFATSLKKNLF